MLFDQEKYNDFVLNYIGPNEEKVIGFFPEKRTLASGRTSYWYWNGRILLDYAEPLIKLANFMIDFCDEHGITPDYFVNVPEGVNKLTDYLNGNFSEKQVMMRAKPKEHGDPKDRYFLGPVEKGDRVVIVEDVTTTGGSLAEVLEKCLDSGLDVIATLCECDRMERAAVGRGETRKDLDCGVREYIAGVRARETSHYALTDATKIVPAAFALWTPPEGMTRAFIANGLEEEYHDHGIVPMNLKV